MTDPHGGPPPFFGKWSRIYAAVLAYLVVLILLLTWFTMTWNR